jgi:hypothetical protein
MKGKRHLPSGGGIGSNKKIVDRRRRARQDHPVSVDGLDLDVSTLKECDHDVGIISCGLVEYCVNKTSFGSKETGRVCVPVRDDHEDDTTLAG